MSTTSARVIVDDGLKTKNRGAAAISGSYRVVKALKPAGTGTIFTLCGAHSTARRG